MNTKTSMLKIAKNLGSVGLLFTITQQSGVEALQTQALSESEAQVDAQIKSLSSSVQQALSQSGEGSEALAESEIQNMIESHVKNMVAEQAEETTVSILANRGESSLFNIQFIRIFKGESLRFKFDKNQRENAFILVLLKNKLYSQKALTIYRPNLYKLD